MDTIYICDIKLAAILIALGIRIRNEDPITCLATDVNGIRKETYTFWFDVTGVRDKALEIVNAYEKSRNWSTFTLPTEHPLYYMKGVLENREVLLNWIRKKVAPMRIIKHGEKTVLIGDRANPTLKSRMKSLL